jgi:hypothetical protein
MPPLPPWEEVLTGLAILDRLRYVKGVKTHKQLVDHVNSSRKDVNLPLGDIDEDIKIPLSAASFWEYILSLHDDDGRQPPRRLDMTRTRLRCSECPVHLLEYMELLLIVHKSPYDEVNMTFLHYSEVLTKLHNKTRRDKIEMDKRLWGYPLQKNDLIRSGMRQLGTRTPPIPLGILELAIVYLQQFNTVSTVFIASIRAVFIETNPSILKYMWPSIVHFRSFPKDKETYIIPMLPVVRDGSSAEGLRHATLAVATVGEERKTGTVKLYDALFEDINLLNLDPILLRLNQCEVGGVSNWTMGGSGGPTFHPGPRQSSNMCVIACICFCLAAKKVDGFQDWTTNPRLQSRNAGVLVDEWWRYRRLVCELLEKYFRTLETDKHGTWIQDNGNEPLLDPSSLYSFPSIPDCKPYL